MAHAITRTPTVTRDQVPRARARTTISIKPK
jgi:hypothetical protein